MAELAKLRKEYKRQLATDLQGDLFPILNRIKLLEKEEELEKCKEENKKLKLNLHELGYTLKGSKLRTVSAASQMHLPPDLKEKIMKAGKKRKSRRRRRRRTKKRKSKKRRKRKTKRKFR